MQYVWRPYFSHLGKRAEIFAHTMAESYCSPEHLGFDILDADDSMFETFVDDTQMSNYNADYIADIVMNYINKMHAQYRSNHLLIPMGCDF